MRHPSSPAWIGENADTAANTAARSHNWSGGFGTLIFNRVKDPGIHTDVPVRMQRSKVPKDRGSIAKLDALGQSLPDAADLAEAHGERPASDLLTGVSREIDRSL